MIDKYKEEFENRGVSPVIGVILLVAVTVALVALATVIVFDIGSDVSDSADATINVQETSTGISVDVIRNENVESLKVTNPNDVTTEYDANTGLSESIDAGEGTYTIVAVLNDGTEETIRTITVTDAEALVSGTFESTTGESEVDFNGEDSIGATLQVTIDDDEGVDSVRYDFTEFAGNWVLCDTDEDNFDSGGPENPEEECATEPINNEIWEDNGDVISGTHFIIFNDDGGSNSDDGTGNYKISMELQDEEGNVADQTTYEFEAIDDS